MITTANRDYLFAATSDASAVNGQTIAAGAGEAVRANAPAANATASEDKLQPTAGAVASSFTFSASGGSSLTLQLAFKR